MKATIKKALHDDNVSYREFYSALQNTGLGFWDNVNSTENIKEYIIEMIGEDITVSHILATLESEESETDDWKIWLGNSMETPKPINNKKDLVEALGISMEDMKQGLTFSETE